MQDRSDQRIIRHLLREKRLAKGLLLSEASKLLDIDMVDMILFDAGKRDLSDDDNQKIERFLANNSD